MAVHADSAAAGATSRSRTDLDAQSSRRPRRVAWREAKKRERYPVPSFRPCLLTYLLPNAGLHLFILRHVLAPPFAPPPQRLKDEPNSRRVRRLPCAPHCEHACAWALTDRLRGTTGAASSLSASARTRRRHGSSSTTTTTTTASASSRLRDLRSAGGTGARSVAAVIVVVLVVVVVVLHEIHLVSQNAADAAKALDELRPLL